MWASSLSLIAGRPRGRRGAAALGGGPLRLDRQWTFDPQEASSSDRQWPSSRLIGELRYRAEATGGLAPPFLREIQDAFAASAALEAKRAKVLSALRDAGASAAAVAAAADAGTLAERDDAHAPFKAPAGCSKAEAARRSFSGADAAARDLTRGGGEDALRGLDEKRREAVRSPRGSLLMKRGDAAAATRIFRGDGDARASGTSGPGGPPRQGPALPRGRPGALRPWRRQGRAGQRKRRRVPPPGGYILARRSLGVARRCKNRSTRHGRDDVAPAGTASTRAGAVRRGPSRRTRGSRSIERRRQKP